MHRISSDSEFLDSGKIVIDADGIPIEPVSKKSFEDALEPKADKSYVDSAVAPKADKSYVDSALEPKADKSYVDSLTPLRSFVGTGSPEGKVTAPVGSVYTDSAATNGAIRWVKTSGTGSAGWVVEYGDTGWRLLANRNESQSGEIYIRRVTNTCFIRVSKYTDPGNYAKHMATIPTGFRPESEFYGLIVNSSATSTNSVIGSYTLNTLSWTRDIDGGYGRPDTPQSGEIAYSTTNSWPTTLPGTPA